MRRPPRRLCLLLSIFVLAIGALAPFRATAQLGADLAAADVMAADAA